MENSIFGWGDQRCLVFSILPCLFVLLQLLPDTVPLSRENKIIKENINLENIEMRQCFLLSIYSPDQSPRSETVELGMMQKLKLKAKNTYEWDMTPCYTKALCKLHELDFIVGCYYSYNLGFHLLWGLT